MHHPWTTGLSIGRKRPKHGFPAPGRCRYDARSPASVHRRLSTDSIYRNVGRATQKRCSATWTQELTPNTPNTFDQRPGDHNGETILVDAVRHGYVEVVRVLVWAGADVNTSALLPKWDPEHGVDPTSWEPSQPLIFLALPPQPSERHFQILRVLLAAGADPNAKLTRRPDQNITLLVVAANNSAYRSMELLFTHRADPDVRPDGDSTPLWDAVSAGDANKTNVLLIGGADPMAIQFSSGSTVIDHAMALGNEDIIHILPGRSMRR